MANYIQFLKNSWQIIILDRNTIKEAGMYEHAMVYSMLTLFIAAMIYSLKTQSIKTLILLPIILIMAAVVQTSISHIAVRFMKGSGPWKKYLITYLNAHLILWIGILPISRDLIIGICYLWLLIINIRILQETHEITPVEGIAAGLIPTIIITLLLFVNHVVSFFQVTGS